MVLVEVLGGLVIYFQQAVEVLGSWSLIGSVNCCFGSQWFLQNVSERSER